MCLQNPNSAVPIMSIRLKKIIASAPVNPALGFESNLMGRPTYFDIRASDTTRAISFYG